MAAAGSLPTVQHRNKLVLIGPNLTACSLYYDNSSLKCVSEDILELSHTVAESVIVLTRQWFVFKVVFVPVSRVAVDILHLHNAALTSTLCK